MNQLYRLLISLLKGIKGSRRDGNEGQLDHLTRTHHNMNSSLNLFILISILINFYEKAFLDILSSLIQLIPVSKRVEVAAAPVELLFIKTVPLPDFFLNFLWVLSSHFIAMPSKRLVITTIFLAASAASALLFHYVMEKAELQVAALLASEIQMVQIPILIEGKKPESQSDSTRPVDLAPVLSDAVVVPTITKPAISYADAVGYDHVEVRKPRNQPTVGYDVYLGDLFMESTDLNGHASPIIQMRRLSYADAVGYDHMEVQKPRNQPTIGYDVYLGDLFEESIDMSYHQSRMSQMKEISSNEAFTYDYTKPPSKYKQQSINTMMEIIFSAFDVHIRNQKQKGTLWFKAPKSMLLSPHTFGGSILSWGRTLNRQY